MKKLKFSNGFLDDSQQKKLKAGFTDHTKEVRAPQYEKERVNWLVYEENDLLIGALTADILWDWIYIDELWVDKNFRSLGIAKKLMKTAEEYAVSHDLTGLWLWTQSWQAAEFYQKLGFVEFARFDDFPKGYQRIGFRKQVSSIKQINSNMIRKYKESDLDQVIDTWLNASIIAHDFIDSEFWKSNVDAMRNVYIPASETYVYEEGGIIKGFVSLLNDTIAALFVSPNDQGSGIGTQLVAKSKEIRDQLNLNVYKENVKSIEFYKKCGFEIVKEQIDQHTGHPELVMSYNS